jgi:hypothetical protein
MNTMLLSLGLLFAPAPESEAGTSALPPEARLHHQRGLAALDAGEFTASITELEFAYSLLPDPLQNRDGRSNVIGSLRAALLAAHAATGERSHLERLHALLLAHGQALRVALGPAGTTEDFVAIEAARQQVEAQLTATGPAAPATGPAEPAASPAAPPKTSPPPPPDHAHGRGLRIAGGVLMGLGTAALGVMSYGLVVYIDNRHKLQNLTESVAASGAPPTGAQNYEAGGYQMQAYNHRSLAAVTGALGAVALATGISLRLVGAKRARTRLIPALGARFAGVTWRLQF